VRPGKGGRWGKTGSAAFLTLFAVPFCIGEVVVLGILVGMTSIWLLPVLLLLGLANVRFHHLLKRPTIQGRKLMDQIEGFRMYLSAAEKDRLEYAAPLAGAPKRTPQLFEKFLPYALALDVENGWAEQFSDVLARAGVAGAAYSPAWYRGTSFSSLGAGGFATAVGGSLSSALSSASTSPSGSGAGGGGSSGGGGGGGGGGGW
ncbi:MAG: hypothetical protein AMJ81_04815, partial [Phycisphaerae bacterium SM23_33]